MRLDDPASPFDSLVGNALLDQDSEPYRRCDPEAESVRSHPSSHADQALLPSPAPASSSRPQTQRLQRRRDHYCYMSGTLVPATTRPTSPRRLPSRLVNSSQDSPHSRAKSYSASGHTSSWLLGGASPFAEAKRNSWTGERRETRKLQKDHPVGSARPTFTVEISNGGDAPTDGAGNVVERDGARGSVLGVRRKMERLRGLYRRGEKDVEVSSSL